MTHSAGQQSAVERIISGHDPAILNGVQLNVCAFCGAAYPIAYFVEGSHPDRCPVRREAIMQRRLGVVGGIEPFQVKQWPPQHN